MDVVLGGLFEIGWAIRLKYSHGFTRPWPSLWTAIAMALSLWLLALAMKTLAVGTAILGIVLLGEPAQAARLASITLIVFGIIGLKLAT